MKSDNLSRRDFMKLAGLGLASTFLIGCGSETEASQPPYKPLDGLCYSPFRLNQSPMLGSYPSESEVREDLEIIKNVAPKIRTYGTENILYNIPKFCKDVSVDCYPGAWIDNVEWDDAQVNDLISVGNSGYSTTKGLVVGNEFIYRCPSSKSKLLNYISQVRQSTGMPVGAAEQWHIWRDHLDLGSAVDFMFVHVHPYWENQAIENAANFVLEKYNFLKQLYPGKQIFIAETGWPTAGETRGDAVPSEENQKIFLEDFFDVAQQNGLEYFLFSAFDERWKTVATGIESEKHWGIFYENRQRKSGLTSLFGKDFRVDGFLDSGEMDIRTFEKNPYTLERKDNLRSDGWNFITNFFGSVGTNKTKFAVPLSGKSGNFRVRTNL